VTIWPWKHKWKTPSQDQSKSTALGRAWNFAKQYITCCPRNKTPMMKCCVPEWWVVPFLVHCHTATRIVIQVILEHDPSHIVATCIVGLFNHIRSISWLCGWKHTMRRIFGLYTCTCYHSFSWLCGPNISLNDNDSLWMWCWWHLWLWRFPKWPLLITSLSCISWKCALRGGATEVY